MARTPKMPNVARAVKMPTAKKWIPIRVQLAGDKELEAAFMIMQKDAPNLAKQAIRAGMSPIRQTIRAEVSAARIPYNMKNRQEAYSDPASIKKAAKHFINSYYRPRRRNLYIGKVGFVGKKIASKKRVTTGISSARNPLTGKKRKTNKRMVGIAGINFRWFVLGGKKQRFHKKNSKRGANHPTGMMPPLLAGIVPRAYSRSSRLSLVAATAKLRILIQKKSLQVFKKRR